MAHLALTRSTWKALASSRLLVKHLRYGTKSIRRETARVRDDSNHCASTLASNRSQSSNARVEEHVFIARPHKIRSERRFFRHALFTCSFFSSFVRRQSIPTRSSLDVDEHGQSAAAEVVAVEMAFRRDGRDEGKPRNLGITKSHSVFVLGYGFYGTTGERRFIREGLFRPCLHVQWNLFALSHAFDYLSLA